MLFEAAIAMDRGEPDVAAALLMGATGLLESAITHNILAQAYTLPERYPHSSPEALAPGPRRALLLNRLAAFDADLYCLQEVEADAFSAIAARLGPDFQGLLAQKRGKPDGCALFLRRDAFTLQHHETLHYRDVDPGYDHLALLARVQHQHLTLTIVSTHLRWQPRSTPPASHQGRLQLMELLDHLDHLDQDGNGAALIAGDMNTLSDGPVIRAALDRGSRLSCRGQRPWDTVNIDGRRRKLDYLLYSPDHLHPTPAPLPRLQRDTPMPSHSEPSDHLPIAVRYTRLH